MLPDDPLFREAISNTENAQITPKGLQLTVVRYQQPDQAGARTIRSGVFYLPEPKSPYRRYYTTGKIGYGGQARYEGATIYRRPLVVKAASGGKGPERAYDMLNGKGAYEKMRSDVLSTIVNRSFYDKAASPEKVKAVLEKYGGDPSVAWEITAYSRKGNTLAYAIQENIVGSNIRKHGYDAVISYNVIGGKPRLSEVFDVRAESYPWEENWQDEYEDFYRDYPEPADKSTRSVLQTDGKRKKTVRLSSRKRYAAAPPNTSLGVAR